MATDEKCNADEEEEDEDEEEEAADAAAVLCGTEIGRHITARHGEFFPSVQMQQRTAPLRLSHPARLAHVTKIHAWLGCSQRRRAWAPGRPRRDQRGTATATRVVTSNKRVQRVRARHDVPPPPNPCLLHALGDGSIQFSGAPKLVRREGGREQAGQAGARSIDRGVTEVPHLPQPRT